MISSNHEGRRITVWGRPGSSCCEVVLWGAAELGLGVDLILKGGIHGGLSDPEFVEINPNKAIPAIRDGDLVLWESAAILQYLASTYGSGSLYPLDPRHRGEAYRWNVWMQTTLRPKLIPLYTEWKLFLPAGRHLDDLEARRQSCHAQWSIVERQLQGRPYLAGDSFTFADIAVGVMADWWYGMPIDHFELPNVEAWYRRLASRPAFQQTVDRRFVDQA